MVTSSVVEAVALLSKQKLRLGTKYHDEEKIKFCSWKHDAAEDKTTTRCEHEYQVMFMRTLEIQA